MRSRMMAVVLAACVLNSVLSAAAQQSPVEVYMSRARAQDAEGRHDLAILNWRQALLLSPRQPEILAALARDYAQQGDAANAKTYLERLHQVQPQENPAPAQTEPADKQSLLTKAAQLAQQHRFPEALALYRKALGANPTSGEWAAAYYETEAAIPSELGQAITRLHKLVSDYPAIPKYRLSLARALTYSPSSRLEGMRMLADFQGLPEDMEAARIAWHDAILWDPSSAAAQETGPAYLQRYPDNDLAEKLRTAHARPTASDVGVHLAEGYRALQAGELETAAKEFTESLNEPGQAGRARLGLGYVAMKQQDFAAAVKNFAQAKSFGVNSAELESAYADARYWDLMKQAAQAEAGSDDTTAAADYAHAIELEADRPEATEALAGLWLKKQDAQKALPLLKEEVAKNKSRAAAWQALANAELLMGRYRQILADQAAMPAIVLAKLQDDAGYLTLVASAQFAVGQRTEAEHTIARIDGLATADGTAKIAVRSRLAQLALQLQDNDDAIKLSLSAVRLDAANLDGWRMLVGAEHAAGLDTSARHVIEQLPESVKTQLMNDPAFLLQAAAIYQQQHENETAAMMLSHAQRLAGDDAQTLFLARLQMASLEQATGHTERAYAAYRKLIQEAPGRTEPWVGLVTTLHAANRDAESLRVVQEIPSELVWKLRDDAPFLQTLASVYAGKGDTQHAMECLRRIRQNAAQQGTPVPFAVDAQYAWLQLNAGDEAGLSVSLSSLSTATGLSPEEQKQVEDLWVARTVRRAESSSQNGKPQDGLKLVDAARQVYPDNPELRREMSALLIRRGHPEQAYRLYTKLDWSHASDADFVNGINAASAAHERKAADMLLQRGLQQYPESRALLTQAAQSAQQNGDIKQAELYWKSVDKLGTPQPVEEGIFALTGHAPDAQSTPMERLAQMFPSTPGASAPVWETQGELTRRTARPERTDDFLDQPQTARQAAAEAVLPLVSDMRPQSAPTPSVAHSSEPMPGPAAISASENDAAPALSAVLHVERQDAPAHDNLPLALTPDDALDARLEEQPVLAPALSARQPAASQPLHLSEATSSQPFTGSSSRGDSVLDRPSSGDALGGGDRGATSAPSYLSIPSFPWASSEVSSEALVTVPGSSDNDRLDALRAQLSPWVGSGIHVTTRSGQSGFDQLTLTDYDVEASTVIGDEARVSVIAHPVMLQTGASSSAPIYGFGTAPTTTPTVQSASGVGGEVQLATAHVQASVGATPAGFLVQNVIGSLTVAPTHSFSLHFTRQPVTQTMLSYAGMQDPTTGQIWGGVVATGGGAQISSGDAQNGLYGSADFQRLTGRNVASSSRFGGNLGGYWKIYENDRGSLTVGANLTGEHYSQTLQYFTYGQGGYFSPDVYLLFGVPVTWQSKPVHNFTYAVSGALGSQTYEQGTIQAQSFLVASAAPPSTTSSANYNLVARASYRISPTWYLEGYASANNANNYQQNSVGFTIRRMLRPHSDSESLAPTGLFDHSQPIRPLLIP